MKVGLLGINKQSLDMAFYIKKFSKNDKLRLSGVHTNSTKETTDTAIDLGISAYFSMESLIDNSDVLLIGYDDLVDISAVLKDIKIKNKILCHFSTEYDSSVMYCGLTNSQFNIILPYIYDNDIPTDLSKTIIVFEGFGRNFEEFKEAIESAFDNCRFCTKTERRLSLIAKRAATIHIRNIVRFAKHMFKIAGVYDEKFMKELIRIGLDNSCLETQAASDSGKTTDQELKKSLRILESINETYNKEFYKSMELHNLETTLYSNEEKSKLQKILGKRISRT